MFSFSKSSKCTEKGALCGASSPRSEVRGQRSGPASVCSREGESLQTSMNTLVFTSISDMNIQHLWRKLLLYRLRV